MPRPTIVFGVDRRYVQPLLVALASLALHGGVTSKSARMTVLHTDLTAADETRIAGLAERLEFDLELQVMVEVSDRYPVTDWISPAAYLRLRLADGCRGAGRVLYLDCDLIAVAPIDDLLAVEPDAPLAAAVDLTSPTVGFGGALPGAEQLGIPADRPYFNSGVMMIDVRRWLEAGIPDRCHRFLIDHSNHVRLWDQDALNVVLDDGWTRLAPEFNAIPLGVFEHELRTRNGGVDVTAVDAAIDIEGRARILHFAGPIKPWSPNCPPYGARDRYRAAEADLARLEAGSTVPLEDPHRAR